MTNKNSSLKAGIVFAIMILIGSVSFNIMMIYAFLKNIHPINVVLIPTLLTIINTIIFIGIIKRKKWGLYLMYITRFINLVTLLNGLRFTDEISSHFYAHLTLYISIIILDITILVYFYRKKHLFN